MTPHSAWLHNYTALSTPLKVYLGDDNTQHATGYGNVDIILPNGTHTIVTHVYYVPGITKNIISVSELTILGMHVTFTHDGCHLQAADSTDVQFCPKEDRLYPFGRTTSPSNLLKDSTPSSHAQPLRSYPQSHSPIPLSSPTSPWSHHSPLHIPIGAALSRTHTYGTSIIPPCEHALQNFHFFTHSLQCKNVLLKMFSLIAMSAAPLPPGSPSCRAKAWPLHRATPTTAHIAHAIINTLHAHCPYERAPTPLKPFIHYIFLNHVFFKIPASKELSTLVQEAAANNSVAAMVVEGLIAITHVVRRAIIAAIKALLAVPAGAAALHGRVFSTHGLSAVRLTHPAAPLDHPPPLSC